MPLPTTEVDATTPKYLRDKYAIVGVGETTYTRGSGKTTRALGHLGGPQRDPRRRAQSRRHRRHAVLFGRQLDLGDLHRRRSRHPPQFLHGRGRRRVVDRGADRHRHRADRGRLCKTRGDLPLDERLFAGAHRRHRRALGGAGRRRHAAQPRLWLAERRAELRPDLHAPHVRLRHQARAGRHGEGGAQPSTPRTTRRRITRSATRSTTCCQQPLHLQAAASAGLLRRDRQRHLRSSSPAPSARRDLQQPLGADPRRRRPVQQAAHSTCITSTGRSRPSPAITPSDILWPNAGVGPEDVDVTGSYDAFTFTSMLQLEDYGFCKKGEGGDYVSSGIIAARRQAAEQHQRRPSVRGLHARHEHGHRERPPAAPRRRRFLPGRAGRQAAAHLRLPRGRLPPGPECRGQRQSRLGQPGDRIVDGHAARLRRRTEDAYSTANIWAWR